jgi:hypothetical protein
MRRYKSTTASLGGGIAMTVCRAVPLAAVFIAVMLYPASAQFGGMPGMPGSPGFGAPPAAPPAACQQLLALRDETQKNAAAIQAANQRKASPVEACKLFRTFLASDTKMIKAIVENAAQCGVPPEVPAQMRAGHAKADAVAKQVCEMAAQGPRPAGPSLSDALGTTPAVPNATTGPKTGGGAFDTLSGNALAR